MEPTLEFRLPASGVFLLGASVVLAVGLVVAAIITVVLGVADADGAFGFLAIGAVGVHNALYLRVRVMGTADGVLLVQNKIRTHRILSHQIADVIMGQTSLPPTSTFLIVRTTDGRDVRLAATDNMRLIHRPQIIEERWRTLLTWARRDPGTGPHGYRTG